MRVLDLFKGTGSVTKYFENKPNVEIISLDILEKFKPTICCDIMNFDYKKYDVGYFDLIAASPECKIFSNLQYTQIGRKWKDKNELFEEQKKHSKFINKTIEIIEYLKPCYYFIENPRYSKIWDYVENKEFLNKFIVVDYCSFGYSYKKPTKILTNKNLQNHLCVCTGTPKHPMRLGTTSEHFIKLRPNIQKKDNTTLLERYSIPPKLLEYLFN